MQLSISSKFTPQFILPQIILVDMNIFLSLLNEPHEDWEGKGFIRRIGDILSFSSRHFQVDDPNTADAVLFLESNRFKSRHDITCFRKTELLHEYAHKSYALNYSDTPVAFLPGLYVCLPRQTFHPCWTRAIPYPWPSPNQQLANYKSEFDAPEFLLSFRGSLSHPVRQKVIDLIALHHWLGPTNEIQRWFNHTSDEQLDYLVEITKSHFVLCPRGLGTSTYRLYEVLRLGRVPIIISDDWVPPEGINWNSCSIRIAEDRITDLPVLIQYYIKRWPEMSAAASTVWRNYFHESVLADFLFDQLESLFFSRHSLCDWDYLSHRWELPSFRRQNQWDFKSKVKRFASRFPAVI